VQSSRRSYKGGTDGCLILGASKKGGGGEGGEKTKIVGGASWKISSCSGGDLKSGKKKFWGKDDLPFEKAPGPRPHPGIQSVPSAAARGKCRLVKEAWIVVHEKEKTVKSPSVVESRLRRPRYLAGEQKEPPILESGIRRRPRVSALEGDEASPILDSPVGLVNTKGGASFSLIRFILR